MIFMLYSHWLLSLIGQCDDYCEHISQLSAKLCLDHKSNPASSDIVSTNLVSSEL